VIDLPQNENELIEEVEGMSSQKIEHLRRVACENLYFMAKGVLGHKDVNPGTHGAFCRFFEDDSWFRRMGLMPRLHLKTTIATESDSIRLACKTGGEARILIANEILGNAQDIVKVIMKHFEEGRMLRTLFPELIPSRFSGPGVTWSTSGATLVRPTPYKEPTFLPIGTGGAAVSKHFTHIKGDDLIGLEAYESPAAMKHAITWIDAMEGLIIGANETWIDWIGTRWAKNDAYGYIIAQYGPRLRVFRRKIHEPDHTGEEQIIFPGKITWEQIYQLMKNPAMFAAQYLNDPLSEMALDFNAENLRYFDFNERGDVVFREYNRIVTWPRNLLHIVLTCDPNSGSKTSEDEAAASVVGMAPDGNVFVLDSFHGRPSPEEFVDQIFGMAKRWRPSKVGIEQAGQQNTLFYFTKKCRENDVYFMIEPLKPENKEKDRRIRTALQPLVATRKLYVLRSQTSLIQQISDFPNTTLKDVIDSVAYAPRLLRKPEDAEELEEADDARQLVLATRNQLTGW
jgi:phage terminase large subunit-like protein